VGGAYYLDGLQLQMGRHGCYLIIVEQPRYHAVDSIVQWTCTLLQASFLLISGRASELQRFTNFGHPTRECRHLESPLLTPSSTCAIGGLRFSEILSHQSHF
jgi:hypothetical protein